MDGFSKLEPMIEDYQLIGDSQLLRLAEQYLNCQRKDGRLGLCISGQTILELFSAIENRTYPISSKIICLIGTNDLTRNSSIETMIDNMNALVKFLLEKSQVQELILLTVPPVPRLARFTSHWDRLQIFNSHISSLANGSNITVFEIHQLFLAQQDSSPCRDNTPTRFPKPVPLPSRCASGDRPIMLPDFSQPPPCTHFQSNSQQNDIHRKPNDSIPPPPGSNDIASIKVKRDEDLLSPEFLRTDSRSAPKPETKPRVLEDMWNVESIKPRTSLDSSISMDSSVENPDPLDDSVCDSLPGTVQLKPIKPTASLGSPMSLDSISSQELTILSSPPYHSASEDLNCKSSDLDSLSIRQKPIGADSPDRPVRGFDNSKRDNKSKKQPSPEKSKKNSFSSKPKANQKNWNCSLIQKSMIEDQPSVMKNETDSEPRGNCKSKGLGHKEHISSNTSQNLNNINDQHSVTSPLQPINHTWQAKPQNSASITQEKDPEKFERNPKTKPCRNPLNVIRHHLKNNQPNKSDSSTHVLSTDTTSSNEPTNQPSNTRSPIQSDSSADSYAADPKVFKANEADVFVNKSMQKNRVFRQGNNYTDKVVPSRGRGARHTRKLPTGSVAPSTSPKHEREPLSKPLMSGEDQCIMKNQSNQGEDRKDLVTTWKLLDGPEIDHRKYKGASIQNNGQINMEAYEDPTRSHPNNISDSVFLQQQDSFSGGKTLPGDCTTALEKADTKLKSEFEDMPKQEVPMEVLTESSPIDSPKAIHTNRDSDMIAGVDMSLQQRIPFNDSVVNINDCTSSEQEEKFQSGRAELSELTVSSSLYSKSQSSAGCNKELNPSNFSPQSNYILNQPYSDKSNVSPPPFLSYDAQPVPMKMTTDLLKQVSNNNDCNRAYLPLFQETNIENSMFSDSNRSNYGNFETNRQSPSYSLGDNRYSNVPTSQTMPSVHSRQQTCSPVNGSNFASIPIGLSSHLLNQNHGFVEDRRFENAQSGEQSPHVMKTLNQQQNYSNQESMPPTFPTRTVNLQYQLTQNFLSAPDSRLRPAAPHFEPLQVGNKNLDYRTAFGYGMGAIQQQWNGRESVENFDQLSYKKWISQELSVSQSFGRDIGATNYGHPQVSGEQAIRPLGQINQQHYSRIGQEDSSSEGSLSIRNNIDNKHDNERRHSEVRQHQDYLNQIGGTQQSLQARQFGHEELLSKPEFVNYQKIDLMHRYAAPHNTQQPAVGSRFSDYGAQRVEETRNQYQQSFRSEPLTQRDIDALNQHESHRYYILPNNCEEAKENTEDNRKALRSVINFLEGTLHGILEGTNKRLDQEERELLKRAEGALSRLMECSQEAPECNYKFGNDSNQEISELRTNDQDYSAKVETSVSCADTRQQHSNEYSLGGLADDHTTRICHQKSVEPYVQKASLEPTKHGGRPEMYEIDKVTSYEKPDGNYLRNDHVENCHVMKRSESFKDNGLSLQQRNNEQHSMSEFQGYSATERPSSDGDIKNVSLESQENFLTNEFVAPSESMGEPRSLGDYEEKCQPQTNAYLSSNEPLKNSMEIENLEDQDNSKVRLHQNSDGNSPKIVPLKNSKLMGNPKSPGDKRFFSPQKSDDHSPRSEPLEHPTTVAKPENPKVDNRAENQNFKTLGPRGPQQYKRMTKPEWHKDDKVTRHQKGFPRGEPPEQNRRWGSNKDNRFALHQKYDNHALKNEADNCTKIEKSVMCTKNVAVRYQKSHKLKSGTAFTQEQSFGDYPNNNQPNHPKIYRRSKNEKSFDGKMHSKVENEGSRSPHKVSGKDGVNNLKKCDHNIIDDPECPKKSDSLPLKGFGKSQNPNKNSHEGNSKHSKRSVHKSSARRTSVDDGGVRDFDECSESWSDKKSLNQSNDQESLESCYDESSMHQEQSSESVKLSDEKIPHPEQVKKNADYSSITMTQCSETSSEQVVTNWEELDEHPEKIVHRNFNKQASKDPLIVTEKSSENLPTDEQKIQSTPDGKEQEYSSPQTTVTGKIYPSHFPRVSDEECLGSGDGRLLRKPERQLSGFWNVPRSSKNSESYANMMRARSTFPGNMNESAFMSSTPRNKNEGRYRPEHDAQSRQENQGNFQNSDAHGFKHPGRWSEPFKGRNADRFGPEKSREVGPEGLDWRSQPQPNPSWHSSSSEEGFPARGAPQGPLRGRYRLNETHERRSNFTMPARSLSAEGFPRMRFSSPPHSDPAHNFSGKNFSGIKMDNFELFFNANKPKQREDLIHLNRKGLGMVYDLIKGKLSKET